MAFLKAICVALPMPTLLMLATLISATDQDNACSLIHPANLSLCLGFKSLESAIGVKLESTHKTLILERLDTKKHYSKGSLWDSNPRLDQLTEIREELRKGWFNQRENDFISASIDLRDWKRKRRNRITTAAISVLSVLLIIAIISYLNAKSQKREALRQLVRINWVNGVNERDKNQDDLKACHYFMKAASIPVDLDLSKNAPLAGAYLMRNIKLHAIIKCDGKILKSFLSHDKKKVTTFSSDGYIRQWDIESGAASAEPIKTEQIVNAQYIDANKGYILLWYNDDTVQAWDTISRTPISVPIKYGCMVIGATISHDKKRILIWSKDNKVGPAIWLPENRFGKKECISTSRIFNCQTGAPLTKLMKHDFQLRGAIFLKKQPSVLTWGMDKIVRLWDINMGEQIASPIKHDRQENPLISRDEKIIITWGEHGGIAGALRRENNNYVSTAYPIHKDIINGAVFNKDQSMVLSWSQDGTIRVWNPYNGKPIFTVPQMHKQAVFGAAFNKDESEILSWSLDGTARLWDSQSGRELIPPLRHSELVRGGIFNKDESKIMTWSIDGITKVWDIRTDSPMVVSITHGNTVREASFCNDEKRIMTWINGILDGTVNLWDSSTGARLIPTIKQIGREFGATVCKNGNRIITWSDEDIKVWDICPSDFFVKSLEGDIRGAILSNDENLMLTWSLDGTAQVRDSYTGKIISKLPHRFSSPLTSRDYCTGEPGIEPTPAPGKDIDGAFFFRNGTRILAWSGNGLMQIFDSITGKLAAKPMTHKKSGQVSFLTPSVQVTFLSKDESRLFTKADKKVWVWDIEKGEKLFPPLEHPGTVWDIEYNEEKNLILTTASSNIRDYQLNLWSGMTGKIIIQPITTKNGSIRNLSFNKDGTLFFYSTGDSLFVRSTQTGELYSKPIRANYTIQGVLYSKNHKYALLWYTNNIAELWDISQAKSMSGLMKHDYFIHNAQFNKDESRILVCASPTVQVWSCPSGRLITPAMIHDSDIDYAVFGNDGKTLLTLTKTGTASIWDGDTGKLVIPPMKYHEAVNGAVFNKIENRFLVWDKDVKAIMRQFKINNDYPKECLLLQAEVHTGTRLNDAGDIEVLPADQWYEKKRKLEALLKKQK